MDDDQSVRCCLALCMAPPQPNPPLAISQLANQSATAEFIQATFGAYYYDVIMRAPVLVVLELLE